MLSYTGQLEEAFALAKVALKNDMKSHIAWHVYGLLYRAEKNYDEAIKAYKVALRFDPESQQIQRDLASLQAQMRDYQGYIQSRTTILQQRPGFRQNWTALAIAYHLAGNLTEAENVLNTYEETLKTPAPRSDMEHSEAILYKNLIIAESGNLEKALEHLDEEGKGCFDVQAVLEMRADYLLRLERNEQAVAAYEELIERNPDNSSYYEALIKAKGLEGGDPKARKAVYDSWAEKNPKGDAARRIPLDFLEGEDFRETADSYMQKMLLRRVPSAFVNIKTLYGDESKRDVVQELVEGYAAGKLETQANGSANKQENRDDTAFETVEGSVYHFLAQHYDYYLTRNLAKAMEYIEKAIEACPNAVYYHMTKARIWKHYGNISKATEIMEYARTLDGSDRYINSKAAKYQLRNNESEKALNTMSKFTRNETHGGTLGDLLEMQCIWYLTEDAESYSRQRKIGLSLKRYQAVANIFDAWQDDQFDFHNFSLRKGMIRAYIDLIRWEDHLRDHPYFTRAALGAIKTYVLLHDEPDLVHGPIPAGIAGQEPNSEERKRALKKAKREQQKLEKAEAEKQMAQKTGRLGGEAKKEDPDPLGSTLAQTKEPMKDAMRYLTPLLEMSPKNIDAQAVGFEVYIRRGKWTFSFALLIHANGLLDKYALALKCLLAAHSINPNNAQLHAQIARFRKTLDTLSEPLPQDVSEVVTSEFETLLPKSTNLTEWNDAFLNANSNSPEHVQSALSVRQLLAPESKAQSEKELLSSLDLEVASIEDALKGLNLLDNWGSAQDAKVAYREHAKKRWTDASIFDVQEE